MFKKSSNLLIENLLIGIRFKTFASKKMSAFSFILMVALAIALAYAIAEIYFEVEF